VGIIYEDLEDHEGYAARLLRDGTITGTYGAMTRDFVGYVAACACGWNGPSHPPTEEGRVAAEEAWDTEHASPLLRVAIPAHVRDAIAAVRGDISELASERPVAAMTALAELGSWALTLTREARRENPAKGPARSGLSL
jgi:hypothetical protein